VALAGRNGRHLDLDAGLLEGADHERPVELGHRLVRDQGDLRVADRLKQTLDGLLRRPGHDDRIDVGPPRPAEHLAAQLRKLDRIDRMDQIAAQDLDRHDRECAPAARPEASTDRLIDRMIFRAPIDGWVSRVMYRGRYKTRLTLGSAAPRDG
jgi:hypothetical protein